MSNLEVTTKDARYVYPTGRIRGLEKHLLKEADLARIKEAGDVKESFEVLIHIYPYSESMKVCTAPEDFEKGLEEEWGRTYNEIRSFAPEPELVDLFWLEQDFHNAKVLFKLYAQEKLPQEQEKIEHLSGCGTLNPELLVSAVNKQDFIVLPDFLKSAFTQTVQLIEKKAFPRDVDLFLDKMYMQKFISGISSYHDNFLSQLKDIIIDGLNIKNVLRIKLWEREDEEKLLDSAIVEGAGIEKRALTATANQPVDSLLEVIRGTRYPDIIQQALEEWKEKQSLFRLEKSMEKIILDFTHRGFYITFGREPLINYIMLRKAEIKKLRGILRANQAGFSLSEMEEIGL